MISIKLVNTRPMPLDEWSAREELQVVKNPLSDEITFERFDCGCECPFDYVVFADPGLEEWKNDKRPVLYRKVIPSDTISIKLLKEGVEVETLDQNANLGTFYDFGDLANPDYTGYVLEWEEVFQTFGPGKYIIRGEGTQTGQAVELDSPEFTLCRFSTDAAHNTVKLDWIQNGNIIRSAFDYTGLNWPQQIRIPGIFWQKTATLEIEEYQNELRERTQIQDKVTYQYTLQSRFIPGDLFNRLTSDGVLGNVFFVTDYNFDNAHRGEYLNYPVKPIEIPKSEEKRGLAATLVEIKFADATDDVIKRNFS